MRTTLLGHWRGIGGMVGIIVMYSLMARAPYERRLAGDRRSCRRFRWGIGVIVGERPNVSAWSHRSSD